MIKKKLFSVLAILAIVLMAGCKEDDYVEVNGVCPVVVSTNPANLSTGVPRAQVISATFNEEMNPSTITQSTFTVKEGTTAVAGTVTYNGLIASFTPSSRLKPNTTYEGRLNQKVMDLRGNSLQMDYVWTFSTGAIVFPMITATDPLNLATGVAFNKLIGVTFSMMMDPSTINSTTFTLKQGTTAVAGTVSFSGQNASFTPSLMLTPNTVYTATVTTGAKNLLGDAMLKDSVWTFTTLQIIAPTVIATDPIDLAVNVPVNKTVSATFSRKMNAASITASSFTLKAGTTTITGVVNYTDSTATFNPNSDLAAGTTYTATITNAVKNIAGTNMVNDYVWSFTTSVAAAPLVILTDPLDLETNVSVSKTVTATFNMSMDPLTISNTTFTLKAGATLIPGMISYANSMASFNPSSDLLENTTYTATITNMVKNEAGVNMVNNYEWSFTTHSNSVTPVVDLKSAADFGILAGVGVSNQAGFSEIRNLNVGIYPGLRSSVVGFPPAIVVNGAIYAADDIAPAGVAAMLNQAKLDLVAAYLYAEGATSPAPATVQGDQGGKTLAPGIYKSTSTLLIQSGNLTLDAQGDPNATWIFQIASGFTTVGGAGGSVILTGGAQAKNVFWQTGSSAVIGDYTVFQGNVLALQSITMNSHATAVGRMLAQNGAVVMTDTNIITKP